jgi:hypothetical protein
MLTKTKFLVIQLFILITLYWLRAPVIAIILSITVYYLFYRQVFASTPPLVLSDKDKQLVEVGKVAAEDAELAVCSLIRDWIEGVESSWRKILMFGQIFKSVRVYLFENDSVDGSREKWLELRTRAPENIKIDLVNPETFALNEEKVHLTYISKTRVKVTGAKVTDFSRISKMCFLRNQCLKFLRSVATPSDYILIADFIKGATPDPRGVLNTIGYLKSFPSIDIISFRGTMKNSAMYFDPFAFQTYEGPTDGFIQLICSISASQNISFNKGLVRCRSTFSGGIFMRWDRIKENCKYEPRMLAFNYMECEHVAFCKSFDRVYINTNMVMEVESH